MFPWCYHTSDWGIGDLCFEQTIVEPIVLVLFIVFGLTELKHTLSEPPQFPPRSILFNAKLVCSTTLFGIVMLELLFGLSLKYKPLESFAGILVLFGKLATWSLSSSILYYGNLAARAQSYALRGFWCASCVVRLYVFVTHNHKPFSGTTAVILDLLLLLEFLFSLMLAILAFFPVDVAPYFLCKQYFKIFIIQTLLFTCTTINIFHVLYRICSEWNMCKPVGWSRMARI